MGGGWNYGLWRYAFGAQSAPYGAAPINFNGMEFFCMRCRELKKMPVLT
jgi:hypothetical protein